MLNGCTHAKNIEELYSVAAVFVHSVKMRLTRRLMKAKKPKFKNRYVLGVGYPWVESDGSSVSLCSNKLDAPSEHNKKIISPIEFDSLCIPKYRLVLEKIK